MNIFVLDKDPVVAAQMHNNRHVVKMILETTQLLHAAYYETNTPFDGFPREQPYRLTHKNHPCTKWARQTLENWMWLLDLGFALCDEFTYRYGKTHACLDILTWMRDNPPYLESEGITPFAQAMPEQYRDHDPVRAYRNYYIGDKQHLAEWRNRVIPSWYVFQEPIEGTIND